MDQKDFESKLDSYAEKMSQTVSEGAKKIEAAFETGKKNLKEDLDKSDRRKRSMGSPRMGMILIAVGVFWLLQSFNFFNYPVFAVLLVALGVFFVLRSRKENADSSDAESKRIPE